MGDIYPQDGGETQASNDPIKAEAQAAKEKLSGAVDAAKGQAAQFADTAKQKAAEKVDQGKETITGALGDFADAIRRAGDELGEKDQTLAARLVAQAADGLETLSRTVSEKRPEEMLNAVRDFGRSNPTAFLAGSILAGLALGRFARSSAQHETTATQDMPGQSTDAESRFAQTEGFVGERASFQSEGDTFPPEPVGVSVLGDDDDQTGVSAPQTGV